MQLENYLQKLLKNKTFIYAGIGLILLLFVFSYLGIFRNLLDRVEDLTYDLRFKFASKCNILQKADNQIVTILFDDYTSRFLSERRNEFGFEKWPIPRKEWGKINNYLTRANSSAIVYDLFFKGQSDPINDKAFTNSIKKAGNIYMSAIGSPFMALEEELGKNKTFKNIDNLDQYITEKLNSLNINTIDITKEKIIAGDLKKFIPADQPLNITLMLNISYFDIDLPLTKALEKARGIGIINVLNFRDSKDAIFRKACPAGRLFKNNLIPDLALSVYLGLLPENQSEISFNNKVLQIGKRKVKLNQKGEYWINWRKNGSYKRFSFIQVYLYEKYYTIDNKTGFNILPEEENYFLKPAFSYLIENSRNISLSNYNYLKAYEKVDSNINSNNKHFIDDRISIVDKYKDIIISPEQFTGKIVFIGQNSEISIPTSHTFPATLLHANILDNLINDDINIVKSSIAVNLFVYIILFLSIFALIKYERNNIILFSSYVGLLILYTTLNFSLFYTMKLWLPLIEPIFFVSFFLIFILLRQSLLLKEELSTLSEDVITDNLTGAGNRKSFNSDLLVKMKNYSASRKSFSLLMIDIDFFKQINDTYGHLAGDQVLKKLSKSISTELRENDSIYRYGGEEFCIILPDTKFSEAIAIANKLLKKVQQQKFNIDSNRSISLTISIGVSTFPEHGSDQEKLVDFADQNLYLAKISGRNRVGNLSDNNKLLDLDTEIMMLEKSKSIIKNELKNIEKICGSKNIDINKIINDIIIETYKD